MSRKRSRECEARGDCPAPRASWRAAEGHQGLLYADDTEMIDGWQVFGRGPSAGARTEWEYGGRMRCDIAMCPNTPGVATIETNARQLRIPAAVLIAVEARSERRK